MRKFIQSFACIVFLSHAVPSAASGNCFKVQSREAGWSYLDAMPGYGIEGNWVQFSADSPMVLWANPSVDVKLVNATELRHSSLTLQFQIANSSNASNSTYQNLKIAFQNDLGGMKADAFAITENNVQIRVLDESRVFGKTIWLKWPDTKVTSIQVNLHVHLRKNPILREFAVGSNTLANVANIAPEFKKEGKLFFFNPDGRNLELCKNTRSFQEIPLSLLKDKVPKEAKLIAP
jgi:hypothetical protein